VFVSVERQSQLYVYKLTPDHGLARDPIFVKTTLAEPGNVRPAQAAGAIHVHPNGRFVYLTNRNSGTVELEGQKVSNGGENNHSTCARKRDCHSGAVRDRIRCRNPARQETGPIKQLRIGRTAKLVTGEEG